MGLIWGDWKGYQRRGGIIYPVTCTDTSHIPGISINIFNMNPGMTKGFDLISEKEMITLKKTPPYWYFRNT